MKLFVLVTLLLVSSVTAQTWKDLWAFPWSGAPMELMMGIACPNASICYFTGSHGDDPFAVYYTTDSFKTVTGANMNGNGVMLLSMAYSSSVNLVAAGVGLLKDSAIMYTKDGANWADSTDLNLVAGQDVESIGPGEFGFIGTTNGISNKNGVLYTKDQGDTWTAFDWGSNLDIPSYVSARYGAFPSSTTWYVSGGSWPSSGGSSSAGPAPSTEDDNEVVLSHTHTINKRTKKIKRSYPSASEVFASTSSSSGAGNGYYAVMTKTTDGGKTWTNQFHNENNFYFNDVCCFSETVCMAVAEGFTDGNSPAARIFGTTDGTHWNELFNSTATNAGMMMCHMVSATEAWTAGSQGSGLATEVVLYHTTNAGKTWTKVSFEKGLVAVMGWSFISPTHAFATAVTEASDCTILELS